MSTTLTPAMRTRAKMKSKSAKNRAWLTLPETRHDKKAAQDDGNGNAPEIFRAGMSDNVLIGAEKERGRQAACARTDQNEGKRDEAEFRRSEPQQYEAHRKSGKQRNEQIAEENDPAIHISSLEESD